MELSGLGGGEERYSRALQESADANAVETTGRAGVWELDQPVVVASMTSPEARV